MVFIAPAWENQQGLALAWHIGCGGLVLWPYPEKWPGGQRFPWSNKWFDLASTIFLLVASTIAGLAQPSTQDFFHTFWFTAKPDSVWDAFWVSCVQGVALFVLLPKALPALLPRQLSSAVEQRKLLAMFWMKYTGLKGALALMEQVLQETFPSDVNIQQQLHSSALVALYLYIVYRHIIELRDDLAEIKHKMEAAGGNVHRRITELRGDLAEIEHKMEDAGGTIGGGHAPARRARSPAPRRAE